ncbi:MAG: KH domain-containing protein [Desulfobacteraceae bacterium]|nr:MAG: KH domain-containing protein [Desulfobacteraceae bacterium]
MKPKELIETLAKAIVDNPEEVSVKELNGQQITVLELSVARDDLGKVIGRGGRIAMALRIILSAVMKDQGHAVLEVVQ